MRIDCGYAADFFAIREYGTSRQFIIFFRTHCIPSGKYSVSSGKQCGLRASHMKVVSAVPNESQVRTGTLSLSVSGGSRWWGQAVLSGRRIAQLFSDCRIMLQSTEMPRHGRRGKEKSSHGWRVSTVSSGIENLRA